MLKYLFGKRASSADFAPSTFHGKMQQKGDEESLVLSGFYEAASIRARNTKKCSVKMHCSHFVSGACYKSVQDVPRFSRVRDDTEKKTIQVEFHEKKMARLKAMKQCSTCFIE